jgi:hypothetical protein
LEILTDRSDWISVVQIVDHRRKITVCGHDRMDARDAKGFEIRKGWLGIQGAHIFIYVI